MIDRLFSSLPLPRCCRFSQPADYQWTQDGESGSVCSWSSASAPQVTAAPAPITPAEDPVLMLIADSERHFQWGQARARTGSCRRTRNRNSYKAVGVLLESPWGGRTEPRIREAFRSTRRPDQAPTR